MAVAVVVVAVAVAGVVVGVDIGTSAGAVSKDEARSYMVAKSEALLVLPPDSLLESPSHCMLPLPLPLLRLLLRLSQALSLRLMQSTAMCAERITSVALGVRGWRKGEKQSPQH